MQDKQTTETHIGEGGLWIPPELREFEGQVVFRTPRGTIQHFQSNGGELEPYYGMIGETDFGAAEQFREPKNPELAPDQVSIKHQGEEAVVLTVNTDPDVRCDGGFQVEQQSLDGGKPDGQATLEGGIIRERGEADE